MYSDKQLQEIRSIAKKCMMELGPLELDDPSDLYPLVRIASNETNVLRFTKSVVLATQEFTISSDPELLPSIHLYGPENLGNNEIIKCHPLIRSPSGKGIEALQNPKINLNQRSNFDDIVLKADKPVLVDFWAEWCGPCKVIGPIVNEIAEDYKDKIIVGKLDVDSNPGVSAKFGIRNIPTVLFFKDGQVADKQVGAVPKGNLVNKVEALL